MRRREEPAAFYAVGILLVLIGAYSLGAAGDLLFGWELTIIMRPFSPAILTEFSLAILLGAIAFMAAAIAFFRDGLSFFLADSPPLGRASGNLTWLAIVAAFHLLDTGPSTNQLWKDLDYILVGFGILSIAASAYLKVHGEPASRREERLQEDDLAS